MSLTGYPLVSKAAIEGSALQGHTVCANYNDGHSCKNLKNKKNLQNCY